jgi:acetate kinase
VARAILVLNAGSSSVKLSVFVDEEPPHLLVHGELDGLRTRPRFSARAGSSVVAQHAWDAPLDHASAIDWLLDWCRSALGDDRLVAVGHRVVHGGARFSEPVKIDAATLAQMEALVPLAPLHQPHNIAAIKTVARAAPSVPQVACFDTAFHRTLPLVAQAFALPRRFAEEGIVRYGFHGLSYEYIASVLPTLDERGAAGRTIVLHLGNGSSMCALDAGKSICTTMGFTALDGLPMGTRSGAIDPGVLLHLMRRGMDAHAIEEVLYEQSGLLGVSGVSSDMRELLARSDPACTEAIDLFVYRIGRELGSLTAALGGLDAIVFTGGIGENATAIRERVCHDADWLGLDFDAESNARGGPRISLAASDVSAWVVPTNEELMIARHVRRLLS